MSSAHPEPRKSRLSGLSPLTPAPPALQAVATTGHADDDTTGTAGTASLVSSAGAAPSTPSRAADRGAWDKITIRIDADLAGQARAAFWATSHLTGCRSFSDWVTEAIADKLARDSAAYNSGEPYTPVPAGNIPTGRRN